MSLSYKASNPLYGLHEDGIADLKVDSIRSRIGRGGLRHFDRTEKIGTLPVGNAFCTLVVTLLAENPVRCSRPTVVVLPIDVERFWSLRGTWSQRAAALEVRSPHYHTQLLCNRLA